MGTRHITLNRMQHQLRVTTIVLWMPHGLAQNGAQVFMMAIEAAAVWVLSPAYRATTVPFFSGPGQLLKYVPSGSVTASDSPGIFALCSVVNVIVAPPTPAPSLVSVPTAL